MSDDRAKAIGDTIRAARENKRLTQQQVADKAGLNVSHYAKVERGDVNATFETLEKIGKVFGLTLKQLL